MKKVLASIFFLAAVIGVVAAAGWYQSLYELRSLRQGLLTPMVMLLKENQGLIQALQTDLGLKSPTGILPEYLAAIRADGVPKHAEVKQRLDRLAENNAAIVALVQVYSVQAKSAQFRGEADKFLRYAIAWRDRWNSVMELFMAGGNYAVAEVSFPTEFPAAVDLEVAAIQ